MGSQLLSSSLTGSGSEMPLPTTKLIPDNWSHHHQPVVLGSFNASCNILSSVTPGAWNDDTGEYGPEQVQVAFASIPCRLQRIGPGVSGPQAELEADWREYLVVIPHSVYPVATGWQVQIVSAPNDPMAAGRRFTINDVLLGSELWERDLYVTSNQTNLGQE